MAARSCHFFESEKPDQLRLADAAEPPPDTGALGVVVTPEKTGAVGAVTVAGA
jgi:hypothetical protein